MTNNTEQDRGINALDNVRHRIANLMTEFNKPHNQDEHDANNRKIERLLAEEDRLSMLYDY